MLSPPEAPAAPDSAVRRLPFLPPLFALACGIASAETVVPWSGPATGITVLLAMILLARRVDTRLVTAFVLLACLCAGWFVAQHPLVASGADDSAESAIEHHIRTRLPERTGRFVEAVFLGNRDAIGERDRHLYRLSGATHLLAISGFNVALLAGLLWFVARWLLRDRLFVNVAAAGAVAVYVAGIGAPASAVRAAVMAVLFFAAQAVGRRTNGLNILFGGAFVTLLVDPSSLFDAGCQLSYAATFGIIAWTTRIQAWLPARPRLFWKLVAGTVAAQALTLPLVLRHFHELSLIAFPANPILIPIFSLLMLLSLASLVRLPLADSLSEAALAGFTALLEALARMPGIAAQVDRPSVWLVTALLALCGLPLVNGRKPRIVFVAFFSALAFAGVMEPKPLDGVYLNAMPGRGAGIVILANGQATLLDDGLPARNWRRFLAELRVAKIDAIASTEDASLSPGGVRALLYDCVIDSWIMPRRWENHPKARHAIAQIREAGVDVRFSSDPHPRVDKGTFSVALGGSDTSAEISVRRHGPSAWILMQDGQERILK